MQQPPQPIESLRLSWKVDAIADSRYHGGEEASTSCGSSCDEVSGSDSERSFIVHKVKRLDTLAGIAIKYSVPIADIRRFNGLLSDTAMHAHGTLLIPTQLQPVSEEVQLMFAEVATGLGRNPLLHSEPSIHASTLHANHLRSADSGSGEDNTCIEGLPLWCQCGECSEDGDTVQSCPSAAYLRAQLPLSTPSSHSFGPVWSQSEVIRRRHRSTSDEQHDHAAEFLPQRCWSEAVDRQAMYSTGSSSSSTGDSSGNHAASAAAAAGAVFSSIGKAIRESAVVQKLKQATAASQHGGPSNLQSAGIQLADVADGVFASLRLGLLPKGNPAQFRVTASPRSMSSAAFHKLAPKCD